MNLDFVYVLPYCDRVFVIETITGSQIKAFLMGILNLDSDLRKKYPADCQTMVSSRFPSHFCQFGAVKGAADLGGIDQDF